MNARDVFEGALEQEMKIGRDALGNSPSKRVAAWFEEGLEAASVGPHEISIAWAVTYRGERLSVMCAAIMYRHKVQVDSFGPGGPRSEVCP